MKKRKFFERSIRIIAVGFTVVFLLAFTSCSRKETYYTDKETASTAQTAETRFGMSYVLNVNTKKIHRVLCSYAGQIKTENRRSYQGDAEVLLEDGYTYCKKCFGK